MKKGARSGPKKYSKQRKHIQIKQSLLISPIKQAPSNQQTPSLQIAHFPQKITVPPLPKSNAEFTPEQLQNLGTQHDLLISLEIMRSCVRKEEAELDGFLRECPAIVAKGFKRALAIFQGSCAVLREERLERMKEETVIFVPPDKDFFEKEKGNILNNWIKQQMKVHEQKQNFEKQAEAYNDIFQLTQQKIKTQSTQIPRQSIQPTLQQITQKLNKQNEETITNKNAELEKQLLQILETTDMMRKIKQDTIEKRKNQEFRKKIEMEEFMIQRVPTHTMALFRIQDYFL